MKVNLQTLALTTRDGTLAKDAHTTNVLDGQKRPGLTAVATLPAGTGQGMIYSPTLGALAIVNNSIYKVTDNSLVGAIPNGVGPYDVVPATPAGQIVFKDATNIWTLNGSSIVQVSSRVTGATITNAGNAGVDGTYPLNIGGPGTGASGTYTILGGKLVSIVISSGGQNYSTPPVLSFPDSLTQVTAATYGGYAGRPCFQAGGVGGVAQYKMYIPFNYPVGGWPTSTQGVCAVVCTNPAISQIVGATVGPQAPYLLGYLPMPAGQPFATAGAPKIGWAGKLYCTNAGYTSISVYNSHITTIEGVPSLEGTYNVGVNMSGTLETASSFVFTSFNNVISKFDFALSLVPTFGGSLTVTTPVTPNFSCSVALSDGLHMAWGATNGVWVIRSDLAQVTYLSIAASGANSLAVSGSLLCVAGSGGAFIYDVTLPATPVLKATIAGSYRGVAVYGNLLFLGNAVGDTTTMYDISTVTAPVLKATTVTAPAANHDNACMIADAGYLHMIGATSFTADYLTTLRVGSGGAATALTSSVPTGMLPGFVFLDNTYYVLTTDAHIRGSNLGDPTTWDPLNFLLLNTDLGKPVAIARQVNYLAAFADQFSILYYDAGNPPPGSPLSPAQNTYVDIGCASAASIVEINGITIFVGKPSLRGRSIYMMTGTQVQVISDEFVDKILDKSTMASVASFPLKVFGRSLYCLTLYDLSVTLVLNLDSKRWSVWTSSTTVAADPIVANSYNQSNFTSNHYLDNNGVDLLQHDTNGKVYQMLPTVFQDDGLPIDVNFVTQILEGENSDLQRIAAAELVGDKVNSTAYVRYSDDDYTTWSTYQTVPLLNSRSQTVRQGATRRRSYQIRHTDNVALNLRTLVLDIVPK